MLLSLIEFSEQLCNPPMTFTKGTSCIAIYFPSVFMWLMWEKVNKEREKLPENGENYTEKNGEK